MNSAYLYMSLYRQVRGGTHTKQTVVEEGGFQIKSDKFLKYIFEKCFIYFEILRKNFQKTRDKLDKFYSCIEILTKNKNKL